MFRFPNVRLAVHSLQARNGLSGAESMVRSAVNFGLIKEDHSGTVLVPNREHQCGCMATAKNILVKHLETRPSGANVEVNAEDIWTDIEEHYLHASSKDSRTTCRSHAPAIMDIMLQQIMRYP